MKYSFIAIVLTGAGIFVLAGSPTFAENGPAVTKIPECQILLADNPLLASGQSGIVAKVYVREGDRIRRGQLLAELDASVPKATLAVATKQTENDVNVRYAQAAADVALAEYEAAQESNRIQPNTFRRIEMRKLRLEQERSRLETEVSVHEFELNELRRDEAAALVRSYRIVAPIDGIVSGVFKSPGEAVQVGEAMLQCHSTEKIHVEAFVEIPVLSSLRKGQQVNVVPEIPNPAVESARTDVDGTVFFIGVLAEVNTVRVLVEVDNRDGLLLAGTDAVIEVPAD
ncbi:MAG: efflux RND transporter periplasmic adaptor subunit [Fuerstiella sp.]|nr:efflux RND transporter periplasmic adaptor subunit [Fuerstiella sp.]